MSGTDSPISDEMLSAYLDGELPTEEVAEVEAALERSEELRALLADLKLVRDEIRQLPKHALAKDFASKIAAKAVSQTGTTPNEPVSPRPTTTSAGAKQSRSRIRMIAGVAGVAATLLIALFTINMQQNGGPWVAATGSAAKSPAGADEPLADSEFAEEGMQRELEEQFDAEAIGVNEQATSVVNNISQSRQAQPMAPQSMKSDAMPVDANTLKLETASAGGIDAIVRFDSPNQQAFGIAAKSPKEPGERARTYSQLSDADDSMTEEEVLVRQQLAAQGITVPPGLRPVYFEGTRADISKALANYGIPSNVQLFGNNTDASQLGLSAIDSFAMKQSRSMKRRSAATSPTAPPSAMAQPPSADLATVSNDDTTSAFKADASANAKNLAAPTQRNAAAQRYRIVFFVKP